MADRDPLSTDDLRRVLNALAAGGLKVASVIIEDRGEKVTLTLQQDGLGIAHDARQILDMLKAEAASLTAAGAGVIQADPFDAVSFDAKA